MRIAHLILTHKSPAQLERLLRALDHPACDLHVHLDRKADMQAFAHLAKLPRVSFIRERVDVAWGGWGTIQATLNGFRALLPEGYDYINVISGQDLPIKPAEALYRHLHQRQGTEFITCESIHDTWQEAALRFRRYSLINWRLPGKFRLEALLNRVFPKRSYPLDHAIVGRANWFTLTAAAARYVLDFLGRHPEVVRYYKYVWGADEFIFSTALYNSPFRERIVPNLVYVDWTGQTEGHPRILGVQDLERLKASDKFFARKFDMTVDSEVFRQLEEWTGLASPEG